MRIALIADAYAPVRTSVAVQMCDLAEELVRLGHTPTMIVPSAGLESAWIVENLNGVEVLRIRSLRTKNIGHIRRAMAEFLLPFMMLRGLAKSPFSTVAWDSVVWYSPTIFFGPLVRALKRKSACKTYLILRDLFPEWAVDMGLMRRGVAYWLFKLIERYQYSVADVIGVQTAANLAYMRRWAGKPHRTLEVLHNWLSDSAEPGGRLKLTTGQLAGKIIFVYAGNMGAAQGMDCLILLAERLRDRSEIGFLFLGRGSDVPRLRDLAAEMSLQNVVFQDEIDPQEIPGLLAECHVGLLALDPRHRTHNVPGKFLTYLTAGLPVLARINAGNDLEEIINTHGVGRVCVGDSIDRLCRFAEELIDNPTERDLMGIRGKELAKSMFSVHRAAKQLLDGLNGPATAKNSDV